MILQGDVLERLKDVPHDVQTCVTSPPYWGLRDYGTATWEGGKSNCVHTISMPTKWNDPKRGEKYTRPEVANRGGKSEACFLCGAKRIDSQLGLENTPEEYVSNMVKVFRAVRRVLKDDGTLWLNLGDSYAMSSMRGKNSAFKGLIDQSNSGIVGVEKSIPKGLKPKDLIGIPWRVAFALQADGWYLRQDIIWAKPNPMPESVTDRCTKSHEYIFLLTKSPKYYFDNEAIKEEAIYKEEKREGMGRIHYKGKREGQKGTGQERI